MNRQIFERLTNVEYKLLEHDHKELYHCGASLKDLGKKCFGINKIEGMDFIEIFSIFLNILYFHKLLLLLF